MKPVSEEVVQWLFKPYMGLSKNYNPEVPDNREDEHDLIKSSLQKHLPAHFLEHSAAGQDLLKASLGYYISKPNYDFTKRWNEILPPFQLPQPPKTLLIWAWQALFPEETWEKYNACTCIETPSLDHSALSYSGASPAPVEESWHLVHELTGPFAGGADDGNDPHLGMKPEEELVKRAIRQRVKPYFDAQRERDRTEVRAAFKAALEDSASDWERLWYSELPPFECPKNPRDLFVWMWEELFPEEPVPKLKR
jgi:hypothetical protein